jgi:ribosome maturation factor RimP
MADLEAIAALVEPEAKALGFDLVRVRWFANGTQEGDEPTLQVMAERPETGQLNIDDCSALSHRLSDLFDRLEEEGKDPFKEAYRLEVSSPGIDRPLTRIKDFADWQGHEAKIEVIGDIDGRKRFRGILSDVFADQNTVSIIGRDNETYSIALSDIAEAKLVLTNKLIAATRPLETEGADEIEETIFDESDDSETED